MADFDVSQVVSKASALGMTMNMRTCSGNSDGRNCIYVAWADTKFPSANISQCIDTVTGAYIANSKCLVMETF